MHRFLLAAAAAMVFGLSGPAQASLVTFKSSPPTVHRGQISSNSDMEQGTGNEALPRQDSDGNFVTGSNSNTLRELTEEELPPTEADLDACVAAGDSKCVKELIAQIADGDVAKAATLTKRAANGAKTLAATDPAKAVTVLSAIMDIASNMTSSEDNNVAVEICKIAADVIARSDVQTANPEAVGKLAGKIGTVVLKPSILAGDAELAKDVAKSITLTAKKEAIKAAYPNAVSEIKTALKTAQQDYAMQELYPEILEFHKVIFPEDEPKPSPGNPSPS